MKGPERKLLLTLLLMLSSLERDLLLGFLKKEKERLCEFNGWTWIMFDFVNFLLFPVLCSVNNALSDEFNPSKSCWNIGFLSILLSN